MGDLISASFSEAKRGNLKKVNIRPVKIKGKEALQFSYLDDRKDITKNFNFRVASRRLDEVLKMQFHRIGIQTSVENIQVKISDRGKMQITKTRVDKRDASLSHDRVKSTILDPNERYDFLVELGVQSQDGKIIAEHKKKFTQINEFLKVIKETVEVNDLPSPIVIYDFGCGNAYITFALHYYFQEMLKLTVETIGVDLQKDLMDRNNERVTHLGWNSLHFEDGAIGKYKMLAKPSIVLSLHACDTATDDALAQALWNEAPYIFAVPCCHKYVQNNLPKGKFPRQLHQIASHGILLQRTCDIITDTFRALILRIMGYKTDVFEFVDTTHSAKNLMIRGVKLPHDPDVKTYKKEYEELKKFWNVTPYLESELHLKLQ